MVVSFESKLKHTQNDKVKYLPTYVEVWYIFPRTKRETLFRGKNNGLMFKNNFIILSLKLEIRRQKQKLKSKAPQNYLIV